jgi:transcriptional regulator with XRE-family HTH domain
MKPLKDILKSRRKELGLTSKELSKRSSVSESLLCELQKGNRRIGEKQASRIASALEYDESEQREFVYLAMNESSQRLLESSKSYPVEILNSFPELLRNHGIVPEMISETRIFDRFVEIVLESGEVVRLFANLSLS